MTPAQQTALESLIGNQALSQGQIDTLTPLVAARNDAAIAAVLSALKTPVLGSIRVENVFDVLYMSGDYGTLVQAKLAGTPVALLAFEVLHDAKTLGPGMVNLQAAQTVALFDQLQTAGLLTQAGRDALIARGTVAPEPIYHIAVSAALESAS